MLQRYLGRASMALALLVALIVALTFAWRWFNANRGVVAERVARHWGAFGTRHPRLSKFISSRFARGEYLGLHLTIGFVLSMIALWIFGAITEDVIERDSLTRFDLTLSTWIRAHSTQLGDRIFVLVSALGAPAATTAIAAFGAVVLLARRNWIMLSAWIAAFGGQAILTVVLKNVIHRPRPVDASKFFYGTSFSFPSGHALGAVVGFGMLAYLIGSTWIVSLKGRVRLGIATAAFVLAIGISRLYLGVHYFSDVVAGYAVGLLWLSVCISAPQVVQRRPSRATSIEAITFAGRNDVR